MNRRDFNKLMAAAVGGALAGAATPALADHHEGDAKASGHSCAGKNECKGKGGCKSGDNGCAGKNSCKGKGGCSSAHAPEAAKSGHSCAGKNECKGKGGCKTGDAGCAGKNSCKGKGGCATGDYAHKEAAPADGAGGEPAPSEAPKDGAAK
jgi:hypothetical protein